MTVAPTYEAIKCKGREIFQLRKNLLKSWALDISVRIVYYHQLSIIFMTVWECVYCSLVW
jgi:hypothetical protein